MGLPAAKGLYINILKTETPGMCLGLNCRKICDFIESHFVKPVIPLELGKLPAMGGTVNCLTWYCPVLHKARLTPTDDGRRAAQTRPKAIL